MGECSFRVKAALTAREVTQGDGQPGTRGSCAVNDPPVGGRKGRFGPASFVRPWHGMPQRRGAEKKSTAGSIS